MNNLDLILSQKGFNAKKFVPYNLSALNELFETLKYYVKEKYGIQEHILNNINFEFVSGINTFAERVKIKDESTIILGENLDVLLELYDRKERQSDEQFELLKYHIFSKIITQKFLTKSKLKEALWMYNFNGDVFDRYVKLQKKVNDPSIDEYKRLQTKKIKSYIFLMGHEFGHILYKMNKLNDEKVALDNYLKNMLLLKNSNVLKNLFLWDSYYESFTEISTGNIHLENFESKVNASDYDYLTENGVSNAVRFYKMIQNDTEMQEEIICDIFAIKFFIISFGIEDGLEFLKTLNNTQSALTLSYHLFESDKNLNSELFYKSFARYIINPELLSSMFKIESNQLIENDSQDDFCQSLLSVYSHFKNSLNDYDFSIPDFFENPDEYQNIVNELNDFCKIP